ncbi:ABC transporter substrate-binding protein [Nesterenkonia xinjiangensis]|uniref:Multiple sugar transport system substrate-binding protein n=1 Tax=Nesterenkonia xinjiangensis TaxID=225327 RepID=A0A7Z0GPB3_9MICC|nr:extracellular solute-binding protein [Nesterenkonia xinjiangensis]NYJ79224.1 multiple sugar transport system substrate-binding protein [Nesterenkonia xinjiangensis]
MTTTTTTPPSRSSRTAPHGSRAPRRLGRWARLTAAGCVGVVALTACGNGGGGGGGEDDDVTLRFAWWGAEHRNALTEELVELYEEQNPHVTISTEYTDWEGYWDQLATQSAGGDAPDVVQMDDTYLREYADRGALLPMDELDTSGFESEVVDNGTTDDGLMGITTGVNTMTVLANPDLFAEAGLEIPDDTTWTWEDYADLTEELNETLGDGIWGDGGVPQTVDLQIWLRQQGKNLTTDDGELGFTVEDAEEYLEFQLELLERGSYPSASLMQEESNAAPGESIFEQGEQAIGRWWSNMVPGLSDVAETDFEMLRYPSMSGSSVDNGLWFKATMMFSITSQTQHPEEAQAFVDFLVNSEEAAEITGMDRGLPANEDAREVVLAQLEGQDAAVAEFIEEVEDEIGEAEPVPALGFSGLQDIAYRFCEEIFFGRLDPAEAAERMHAEMESEIQ